MLIAQNWYDTPTINSYLEFKSDFTQSTYKKVYKEGF